MYYIYHITGIKIGCSTEPAIRVAKQGFTDYAILEEHSCIYEASRREHELQRKWGYPVDTVPYWKSRQQWGANAGSYESRSAGGRTGGRMNIESGHLANLRKSGKCKAGGKVAGRIAVESGHLARIRTKESLSAGGKVAGATRVQCPYCDMISNPGAIGHHKKTCKNKLKL